MKIHTLRTKSVIKLAPAYYRIRKLRIRKLRICKLQIRKLQIRKLQIRKLRVRNGFLVHALVN
jgi:hypothetical protein